MSCLSRRPQGGSHAPEMSYVQSENWWHHKNANVSAISCTYFSRNSCRPCRRWSTWCGLFILKKGVLDGSSGNCLYKQQANTQLKPKPKQRRKMLQENANPKHLKFMSHVPEAQETEFENARLRKWGASDTTWKEDNSDFSGPVVRPAGMPG